MVSDPNSGADRNQVEARQGTTRPKVIYITIASTALVIVAFIIAWLISTK